VVGELVECGICGINHCRNIQLLDTPICEKCEKEVVKVSCEDIKYEFYNILFKKLWREYLIKM